MPRTPETPKKSPTPNELLPQATAPPSPAPDALRYPLKKYRTLVMDPPWPHMQKGRLGAISHYPLMGVEEIANLPIPDLLEDDAFVFIWCFVASRYDAQTIAEQRWHLTFRGELIWDKRKTGLGNYLRGSHEHLLLFSRGKAKVRYKGQRDVADWPVQAHSAKPEEAWIAAMRLSPGPYAELFARTRFPGVDAWGFDAPGGSDLFIPGYPVPSYSAKALDPRPGSHDEWTDGVVRRTEPPASSIPASAEADDAPERKAS